MIPRDAGPLQLSGGIPQTGPWYCWPMAASKTDIAELEPAELEAVVSTLGVEPFHARQIYRWIYRAGWSASTG